MRVVVTGGRDFDDAYMVHCALENIRSNSGIAELIHGGARGADSLCAAWASVNGVPVQQFRADWNKHGKGAGPIRNQRMIDEGKPDVAVAFAGGRGTADMVRRCKASGIPVIEVESFAIG
jgi:hypothetical protein